MLQVTTPPSPSIVTATSNAAAILAPVEVAVTGLPANIDQLLRQIQVSGTVATAPVNGTLTLATSLGNFTFALSQMPDAVKQQLLQQLDSLFQNQKQLTATILPGAPPTQAVLLLPNSGTGQTPLAAPPQPLVSPAPLPQSLLSVTTGTVLPAVVLPPDIVVPGAANPTTAPSLASQVSTAQPSQSQETVGSNSPALPASNAAPTQAITPSTTSTAPLSAPTTTVAPANATAVPLQTGSQVVLTVVALSAPSAPAPPPTAANQISATVIGNGSNGQLIVKTADATLYVRAEAEAPIGSHLLVTIEAQKAPSPALLPRMESQNFASLQETLDALTSLNPALAQQFTAMQIPQPNAQLAGPLLFFLSALKQGEVKSWLGKDAIDVLTKNGKLALIGKLTGAMTSAVQTAHDSTVGEWKSYAVPLLHQGQIQEFTLHVHSDAGDRSAAAEGGTKPKDIRFLIDIRMSRFGAMQLDGLVRPQKLDMIVRSESALPAGLPQDLRATFIDALETMGYSGGLSFQSGRQHWLSPRKDIRQSPLTT